MNENNLIRENQVENALTEYLIEYIVTDYKFKPNKIFKDLDFNNLE